MSQAAGFSFLLLGVSNKSPEQSFDKDRQNLVHGKREGKYRIVVVAEYYYVVAGW
jgi:hypothetical protein